MTGILPPGAAPPFRPPALARPLELLAPEAFRKDNFPLLGHVNTQGKIVIKQTIVLGAADY